MARVYRHLWRDIVSFENIYLAFRKAARGKRSRPSTAGFEFHLEENLIALRQELMSGAYQPGGYTSFVVHDPKRRLISAAPFRDRVVHHALMNGPRDRPPDELQRPADSATNRTGGGIHCPADVFSSAGRFPYSPLP